MGYNSETVKEATNAQLVFALDDLHEVIGLQEKSERLAPGSCPKLPAYYDEVALVNQEQKRRREADKLQLTISRGEASALAAVLQGRGGWTRRLVDQLDEYLGR